MTKRFWIRFAKWLVGIVVSTVLIITASLYLFKDQICNLVIEEVNKHLVAKVSVESVDLAFWSSFPRLSVDFNKVFIPDSYPNATERDTFVYSDRIRLQFNPIDVWNEEYKVQRLVIQPGTVQIKYNKSGEENFNILKPSDDSTAQSESFKFELKKVIAEDLRVAYDNQLTGQHYATDFEELSLRGDFSSEKFLLDVETRFNFKQAKSGEVTLLKNKPADAKMLLSMDFLSQRFSIHTANLNIGQLPFKIEGYVNRDSLNFHVVSKNLALDQVVKNLAPLQTSSIQNIQGKGKVSFDLAVDGTINKQEPVNIACQFRVNQGQLIEPQYNQKISQLSMVGAYSNRGGPQKEYLRIEQIDFVTNAGPFHGSIELTQFASPLIRGKADGNINLAVLHALFPIPKVQDMRGDLSISSDFAIQLLAQSSGGYAADIQTLNGEAKLISSQFQMVDDQRIFKDINGSVYLLGNDVGMNNLSLSLNDSDVKMNGLMSNLIGFLKEGSPLTLDVELHSNRLTLSDLATVSKEDRPAEERSFVLPQNLRGLIRMSCNRLNHDKHKFEQISSVVELGNRLISVSSFELTHAGARVSGSMQVEERLAEVLYANAQIRSSNIELSKVFQEWNNFDQLVVTDRNISGQTAIEINLSAPFDLRNGILLKAIDSDIHMKVVNGRLKNVALFDDIISSLNGSSAKLVLNATEREELRKSLKNLSFSDLENTLLIHNGIVELPEMTIATNVLSMQASGFHTFDNKIDYRFSFRLRDLQQKKEEEFGNVVDDGTGIRIYMRMHGDLDNPQITWDKDSRKEDRKAYNEQEKQNIKSILKSEFGLYKNDSLVKIYEQKSKPREELKVFFGKDSTDVPIDQPKPKKESNLSRKLKEMKAEAEKNKQVEWEIDD